MSYIKNIVAAGETGQSTLTAHSLLCGAGASPVSLIPVGSSGQLLQSAGSSMDPGWTTATYPSTAGTSGNVLTSDGTNWSSSAPSGSASIFLATGTLTSSQIKNLHATPITAIAAQGSGKSIIVFNFGAELVYGGTNAFVASASQQIAGYYNSTGTSFQFLANSQLTGTQSYINIVGAGSTTQVATNISNQPFVFYNSVATEISGNAANNNTINWWIQYYVVSA